MRSTGTFETLSNDLVCLILEKTLKPKPPGIDSATIASLACVSTRYATLVKDIGWERLCKKAVPDFCEALVTADKKSPGDAGWASFAKLLTHCPGYDLQRVTQVKDIFSAYYRHLGLVPVAHLEGKQTKDLDTCQFAFGSHTSDSWHNDSWRFPPTTLEGCFRTGNDILPGLLANKGGSILLLSCTGRPWPAIPGWHEASFTRSNWTACKESGDQWVQEGWGAPRSGLVVVYRGMAVNAAALSFPTVDGKSEQIYEDAASALASIRKTEGGQIAVPLSVKPCPFCPRPMQRIPKSVYGKELQRTSHTAEFHICEVGHVFGASAEEDPPEEANNDSGEEDDFEGGYSHDLDEEDGDEDLDEELDEVEEFDEEEDEEADGDLEEEEDKNLDKGGDEDGDVDEEEEEYEEEIPENEDESEWRLDDEDHPD